MVSSLVTASISERKANVWVGFGKTFDDSPNLHVWFVGTGISFHIAFARDAEVFAKALEMPSYELESWSAAPNWFVQQISGDKVRVGCGGIELIMSPEQCKELAKDIRTYL